MIYNKLCIILSQNIFCIECLSFGVISLSLRAHELGTNDITSYRQMSLATSVVAAARASDLDRQADSEDRSGTVIFASMTSAQQLFGCGYNSFKQINDSGQSQPSPVEINLTHVTCPTDTKAAETCERRQSCVVVGSGWASTCFSSGPSVVIRGFCGNGSTSRCLPVKETTSVAAIAITDKRLWTADTNCVIRVWKDYNFDDPSLQVEDSTTPSTSPAGGIHLASCEDRLVIAKGDGSASEVSEESDTDRMILRPLSLKACVKAVSCGKEHVLLLSRIGAVFSYGQSSRGQCGHGDTKSRTEPEVLESLEGLSMNSIAAGGWHSVAISDCDDAYTWGWNESGQLGLPCKTLEESRQNESETTDVTDTKQADDEDRKPVNLQLIPQVLEVTRDGEVVDFRSASCGSRHTTLLDDSGMLYTCGWNAYGQLVQGDFLSRDMPTPVDYFSTRKLCVTSVTCGPWNTFVSTQTK